MNKWVRRDKFKNCVCFWLYREHYKGKFWIIYFTKNDANYYYKINNPKAIPYQKTLFSNKQQRKTSERKLFDSKHLNRQQWTVYKKSSILEPNLFKYNWGARCDNEICNIYISNCAKSRTIIIIYNMFMEI